MTLHIADVGACSPLGLTASVNEAEIAAGTIHIVEVNVEDPAGKPVRASRLGRIAPRRNRTRRMAALAGQAARDCLDRLPTSSRWEFALFIGLPAAQSGGSVDAEYILSRIKKSTAGRAEIKTRPEWCFPLGRAAFFHALDTACRHVDNLGGWALAGAVDSLADPTTLTFLALSGRTLGFNPDGIIPGEAAAFALVGREELRIPSGGCLKVLAHSVGEESRNFKQNLPNLAAGLTGVFRSLRRNAERGHWRPSHMISGQTGERFYAKEFCNAYLRNARLAPEPLSMSLTAEWLGDCGAAAGAAAVVAARSWLRHRADRPSDQSRVLTYACSDEGAIGACVLEG